MNMWAIALSSFFGAVLSALGMGGGGILIIYLTAYAGMDQLGAQGINLLFFIPVALVALFFHARAGLVRWRIVPACVLLGLAGVYCGTKLAMFVGSELLSKLFGGFLLVIGIRELFAGPKKEKEAKKDKFF